jgi:hypothetical protein
MMTADEGMIRHLILNSIRMHRKAYKVKFGELVIVNDGWKNWRRDVFPNYKAKRKVDRTTSKVDWKSIFKATNKVFDEIGDHFPYRTLRVGCCEADDIVAFLVESTQEFGQSEPVLIISSDKDFGQLHRYSNVSQYSPKHKQMLKIDNPRLQLEMQILQGDSIDGIPNVLSNDDVFVTESRQTPLRQGAIDQLLADPHALGENVYRNYLRNKKLIDFREIPASVNQEILNTFNALGEKVSNKRKVMPYLIQNDCVRLLENLGDFV